MYEGRLLGLTVEQWGEHEREIVEHPGAVAVVAVDGEGYVTLVRQLREPARKRLLELPAGLVDPGEQPIDTARRELEEETGFSAGHLEPLLRCYTSPGFCTEVMHIFVATHLQAGDAHPDEGEEIELVRRPLEQAIDQVLSGEIGDAKTVAGLLAYWRWTLRTTDH